MGSFLLTTLSVVVVYVSTFSILCLLRPLFMKDCVPDLEAGARSSCLGHKLVFSTPTPYVTMKSASNISQPGKRHNTSDAIEDTALQNQCCGKYQPMVRTMISPKRYHLIERSTRWLARRWIKAPHRKHPGMQYNRAAG